MPQVSSMAGKRFLMIAFFAAAIGPAHADNAPLAKQRVITIGEKRYLLTSRLKAVLVGEFTYGYKHLDGVPNMDSALSRIGRAEGWTVDRITNGNDVTAGKLAGYQVFFGNCISDWSSPSFPLAGRAALQDFVENKGKGLFVLHSSGDAHSTAWDWFRNSVHPCHYNGEAGRNNASTGRVGVFKGFGGNPSAAGHPILEGIAWAGKDSTTWQSNELHTFDKNILDASITPAHWQGLLSLNVATCGTPNTCGNGGYDYAAGAGGNWPVSWTFPLKQGAIGYFMEGHDLTTMNSMTQAVWDRFFKQFMYYLAGYDTTEVPPTAAFPAEPGGTLGVDLSGITFREGEGEAGVFLSKIGPHRVEVYDTRGRLVREFRGGPAPAGYVFAPRERGEAGGLYVMRAAVPGAMRTKRFFLR